MTAFKKTTASLTAFLLVTSAASAQNKPESAPEAWLIKGDKGSKVYPIDANKTTLRYKESPTAGARKDARLSSLKVLFVEPAEFAEAKLLFQNRKYAEAKSKFASAAELFKKFREVDGNYYTLAKFYEMECARELNQLSELSTLMSKFIKDPLVNKDHLTQIEINEVIWDAVRKKDWTRLINICESPEWIERKLPGSLRAQIAFALGLSYEGNNKPMKALNAYNRAFTADFAASANLARQATLACFRLLANHPDSKLARKLHGSKDYDPNSNGAFLLKEGGALTSLWEKSLGGGEKLPPEFVFFRKFAPKKG